MLANTVLLLALGALTSAQQFKDFPSVLTCQTGDGTTTVDIPQEVSQKAVVRGSGGPAGTLMEESAANASSGKCTRLAGIPYFVVEAEGTQGLYFAYDKAVDTYFYCGASGVRDSKSRGFPTQCKEN